MRLIDTNYMMESREAFEDAIVIMLARLHDYVNSVFAAKDKLKTATKTAKKVKLSKKIREHEHNIDPEQYVLRKQKSLEKSVKFFVQNVYSNAWNYNKVPAIQSINLGDKDIVVKTSPYESTHHVKENGASALETAEFTISYNNGIHVKFDSEAHSDQRDITLETVDLIPESFDFMKYLGEDSETVFMKELNRIMEEIAVQDDMDLKLKQEASEEGVIEFVPEEDDPFEVSKKKMQIRN